MKNTAQVCILPEPSQTLLRPLYARTHRSRENMRQNSRQQATVPSLMQHYCRCAPTGVVHRYTVCEASVVLLQAIYRYAVVVFEKTNAVPEILHAFLHRAEFLHRAGDPEITSPGAIPLRIHSLRRELLYEHTLVHHVDMFSNLPSTRIPVYIYIYYRSSELFVSKRYVYPADDPDQELSDVRKH